MKEDNLPSGEEEPTTKRSLKDRLYGKTAVSQAEKVTYTRGLRKPELRSKKKRAASVGMQEISSPNAREKPTCSSQPLFHSAVAPRASWPTTETVSLPNSSPVVSKLSYYDILKANLPDGFVGGGTSQPHEAYLTSLPSELNESFVDNFDPFADFGGPNFGGPYQPSEATPNYSRADAEGNLDFLFDVQASQFMGFEQMEAFFSGAASMASKAPTPSKGVQDSEIDLSREFNFHPLATIESSVPAQEYSGKPPDLDIFGLDLAQDAIESGYFHPGPFEPMTQLVPPTEDITMKSQASKLAQSPEVSAKANNSRNSLSGDTSLDTTLNSASLHSWQLFKKITRYDEIADGRTDQEEPTGAPSGNILEETDFKGFLLPQSLEGLLGDSADSQKPTSPCELPNDPKELAEWEEFKRRNAFEHKSQGEAALQDSTGMASTFPKTPSHETIQLETWSWSQFKQKTGYGSESAETPAETVSFAGQFLTPNMPFFQNPTPCPTQLVNLGLQASSISAIDKDAGYQAQTPMPLSYGGSEPSRVAFVEAESALSSALPFADPPGQPFGGLVADVSPQPISFEDFQEIASESQSHSSPFSQSQPPPSLPATPLVRSTRLSQLAGCQVFLKMEGLQLGGTHKIRGLWKWVTEMANLYGPDLQMVVGELPNMGIACAAAVARHNWCHPDAQISLTAVVPACAPGRLPQLLDGYGAKCCMYGQDWGDARNYARTLVEKFHAQNQSSLTMPPLDQTSGLASLSQELREQMRTHTEHGRIDAILCPVGSGALLASLVHELSSDPPVPVIGVETTSTDLLHNSILQKKIVCRPPPLASDTISLAGPTLCHQAFEATGSFPVIPVVVSEAMAANAALQFSDDHNALIEPASGAALSPIYHGLIPSLLPGLQPTSSIVVVVTGGNLTSLSDLTRFSKLHSHPPIQARSRDQFFL
ncbi:catabolic L-serine/threonine dehydratase, partial [Massospora cicadina]